MIEGEASRTAWGAALHRAAHQVLDGGRVFPDPVAVPITGWSADRVAHEAREHPQRRGMRAFIACRHRYARDVLASRPDAQVVVLGAGLDTIAYQPGSGLSGPVYEVDHPATQRWKRELLAAAGIAATVPVMYVGVDFETDDLASSLAGAGVDGSRPVVVLWLGVTVYLTRAAIEQTLSVVAGLSTARTDVVLDYGEVGSASAVHRAEHLARIGEPWLSRFRADEMGDLLRSYGCRDVEDLGLSGWGTRYLGLPAEVVDRPGGHLVHAVIPAERPDD